MSLFLRLRKILHLLTESWRSSCSGKQTTLNILLQFATMLQLHHVLPSGSGGGLMDVIVRTLTHLLSPLFGRKELPAEVAGST